MLADILLKVAGMTAEDQHQYYPRPSMSGPERCIRQMTYHAMGLTPDKQLADRMVLVFDDGHWHEELTNDWIRKTAYQLHSEQMVVDVRPPMKTGSIDGIITDMAGLDWLFDHKAMNHFTFQRYWTGEELPVDYFTQLAIYADGIQRTANPDLKNILLLVKNKNTAQYMEFQCYYEGLIDRLTVIRRVNSDGDFAEIGVIYEYIVQETVNKFYRVAAYARKKILPKRPYAPDHWRCNYCRWNETCYKDYQAEEKIETATLPEKIPDLSGQLGDTVVKLLVRDNWKTVEKPGKKAEKEIKDFMLNHKISEATIDGWRVIAHETKIGHRFKFYPPKEKK